MRRPCAALFMTPVIQWNGDVTTCCYDPLMELKVGNINEKNLEEIWYSDEMHKRRIMQIIGDFSYPKKCITCKNVDGIEMSHEEVINYLKALSRQDLIPLYLANHKIACKDESKILLSIEDIESKKWDIKFHHYVGEDGNSRGYTYILGENTGYFEFKAENPGFKKGIRGLIVAAHLSLPHKKLKGCVDLYLNGKFLGTKALTPITAVGGKPHFWIIRGEILDKLLLKKEIHLKFSVKGNGLCIFGKPLDTNSRYFPLWLYAWSREDPMFEALSADELEWYLRMAIVSGRFDLCSSEIPNVVKELKAINSSKSSLQLNVDKNPNTITLNPEASLSSYQWESGFVPHYGLDDPNSYCFVEGYGKGFFEYTFINPYYQKLSSVIISANLVSLSPESSPEPMLGRVSLFLNGLNVGERVLFPLPTSEGMVLKWKIQTPNIFEGLKIFEKSTIRFAVCDPLTYGLAIIGPPLSPTLPYFPIQISFFENSEVHKEIESRAEALYSQKEFPRVCAGFWKSPTLNWNGDLTVCCRDSFMQLKAGNLLEAGFNEVWWHNPEMNLERLSLLEGKRFQVPLCCKCQFGEDITVERLQFEDARQYLGFLKGKTPPPSYKDSFLTIELTNQCNLRCIMCPQAKGNPWKKWMEPGFMRLEDFKKIIENLIKEKQHFRDIVLFWFGEPLLHPNFKEIVTLLSEYNSNGRLFDKLVLHTNALLLDGNTAKALFGLKEYLVVHFSLDAATSATYEKIRVGGNFEKAVNNTKKFIHQAKSNPRITSVVQFIVMEENRHEIEGFRQFWESFFKAEGIKFRVVGMENLSADCQNYIFFRKLANQSVLYGKRMEDVTDEFYYSALGKIISRKSHLQKLEPYPKVEREVHEKEIYLRIPTSAFLSKGLAFRYNNEDKFNKGYCFSAYSAPNTLRLSIEVPEKSNSVRLYLHLAGVKAPARIKPILAGIEFAEVVIPELASGVGESLEIPLGKSEFKKHIQGLKTFELSLEVLEGTLAVLEEPIDKQLPRTPLLAVFERCII